MRRYESYKNSGIKWIGVIPKNWEVRRLKFDNSLHGRIGWNGLRADEFEKNSYAYLVTGQDFNSSQIEWNKCYQINKDRYLEDPFIQLKNGDILITKDGTIGKISMVRNMDKPACLNSGIFVLKQFHDKYDQEYLYWLLVSDVFKAFNNYTNTGTTILHLYQRVFQEMPFLCPPKDEQRAIATYLNKKVAYINNIISERQKKISLLDELKVSIISHAVTKGIEPNSKMKFSGIDWIGDIPIDWGVRRLRTIAYIVRGGSPRPISEYISDRGYNWIKIGDTIKGSKYITHTSEKIKKEGLSSTRMVHVGDLILSNSMSFGQPYILKIDGCIHDGWLSFSNLKDVDRDYLYYSLISNFCKFQFKCQVAGGVVQNLNIDKVKDSRILLPPLSEQLEIVKYIENHIVNINKEVSIQQREISLLQEYKQSLITEVVTGKRKII